MNKTIFFTLWGTFNQLDIYHGRLCPSREVEAD